MDEEKLIERPKADENVTVEKNEKKGKTKINNKKLFLLFGIVILFIAIVFSSLFLFVMSPKKVISSYVSGMKSFDSDRVVNTMHNDFLKAFKEYQGKDFKDVLDTSFKAYKTDGYEIVKYEVNYNYTKFTSNQEKAFKKMLQENYKIDTKKIKELRYYPVRYEVKYNSTGVEDIFTQKLILAKIGFRWYVFPVGEEEVTQ